jgi:hypothetical protein
MLLWCFLTAPHISPPPLSPPPLPSPPPLSLEYIFIYTISTQKHIFGGITDSWRVSVGETQYR